jgi:ArsR family transcriptional regulator, arsenate/arsenite/antimonite-responsive transcriptional repressor
MIFSYANMDRMPVDRMFRAFSDPIRLRILHLLGAGELCVGDVVTVLNVPQPTASRHLGYLRRAGLISARKKSYWTFYALTPPRSAFHQKLLECLDTCFRDVPALAKDAARLKRVRARGGCCPS